MQIDTTRFGSVEVAEEDVITFTQPIIGFQEYRRFVMLPGPGPGILWLQSVDSGELAFILMDPRQVVADYTVELAGRELAELAVNSVDDLEIYTIVVVPEEQSQIRTNLKAPVLFNRRQRLGKQTILERSNYPVRFYLAQAQGREDSPQEVANARSDS